MTVKARCPVCDTLQGITVAEKHERGTSHWCRIDLHAANGKVCEGSGQRV